MPRHPTTRQLVFDRKGRLPRGLTDEMAALRKGWRPGQPVPVALRKRALELYCSGVLPREVARLAGVSYESIRLWANSAGVAGQWMSATPSKSVRPAPTDEKPSAAALATASAEPEVVAPARDSACGLSAVEQTAILELKQKHPSMGPAQIRTQLKRFKGWRLSVRAIAKALTRHGYETVHVASTPKDQECRRFEAPHRGALWQADFAELRVGSERVHALVVLDDFSRYCVAHEILPEPTSDAVVEVLKRAIHQHGKPEALYTDRAGSFLAWRSDSSLQKFLEVELIDHHVTPSYRPQGRGKVESFIGTIQRELWNVIHFESVDQARQKLHDFVVWYNTARAHMGIDGLTPADRFFGRWEEVKARVDALSRGRQLALAGTGSDRLTEEIPAAGGPAEVLRLVCVDGRLELRFYGHRVDLGAVEP